MGSAVSVVCQSLRCLGSFSLCCALVALCFCVVMTPQGMFFRFRMESPFRLLV